MAQGLRDCGLSLEGEAFTWEGKQILSIRTGEAGPKHKLRCGATLRIFPEWFFLPRNRYGRPITSNAPEFSDLLQRTGNLRIFDSCSVLTREQ